MDRPRDGLPIPPERVPTFLLGFALLFGTLRIGEFVVLVWTGSSRVHDGQFWVGLVTSIIALLGIAYGAIWLQRSELSPSRYPRIASWCIGIGTGFLLLNLALFAVTPSESLQETVSWFRWAASLGLGIGLLMGLIEGRAVERAVRAERNAIRAEELERQRDMLDYLNSILRHEVLNAATIINGYASRLEDEESGLDADGRRWVRIIREESDDMSDVIDDVRVLLATTTGDHELEPTNLTAVLTDEVRKLHNAHDAVDVETTGPEDVLVRADDLLARVFGNILSNAVRHDDDPPTNVTVTVERTAESAVVEIADDGPGIPPEKRDTLFEREKSRGSTHGLGLYLVDQLVTTYGGEVRLDETGSDGSRFAVELPRASTDADRAGPDEPTAIPRS